MKKNSTEFSNFKRFMKKMESEKRKEELDFKLRKAKNSKSATKSEGDRAKA